MGLSIGIVIASLVLAIPATVQAGVFQVHGHRILVIKVSIISMVSIIDSSQLSITGLSITVCCRTIPQMVGSSRRSAAAGTCTR